MEPLVSLESIDKRFGGVVALRGVSLSIARGEVHCLAGENGSGKSTLIEVLAGVEAPDAGRISIAARTWRSLAPIDAVRAGVQVIFQDLCLFGNLSVAENLALNRLVERGARWVARRRVRRMAREALETLGIDPRELGLDLDRRVEELPVASRQVLAIARALFCGARLVVMDEPTAALGRREVETLFGVIRRLRERGVSVLFVSHQLREMLRIADRFTILRSGEVVARGAAGDLDELSLARALTGRPLDAGRSRAGERRAGGEEILRVEGWSGPLLRDVSFTLRSGEILGLAGLLGAGQREIARALFGVAPPRSGSLRLDGKPVSIRGVPDAVRLGVACVPSDRLGEGLFLEQSIARNLVAADLDSLRGPLGLLSLGRVAARARRWIDALSVKTPSARLAASSLSGGNQQRVVLGRWLATRPRVLILDGPTAGVDVGSKEEIHRQLRELAAGGLAILLVSDDLGELARVADRVLVLRRGRVVSELSGDAWDEESLERELGLRSR